MKKFEYKTIKQHGAFNQAFKERWLDSDGYEDANELGLQGWELVTVYEYANNRTCAVFKRELE